MLNITQYEQLEKAYGKTLREIASDSDSWKRFLDSAGYTYRQSFKNQVAMYSQKPGMKAVLTEKRWEDMNRAVKSGTTGVRIFDDKSPNHISYVFDYADTVPGSPPPGPRPWTVHKNKTGIALHNLLKRTGEKNLDNYVQNRVRMIVDSEVDPGAEPAVRAALQRCLEQSAMYVTCVRLGLPTERLDTGAFSFPTRYRDNGKVIQRIGTLLNHTLRACLEPVRDVAYSMNMTMPAPEEIAAQAKQPEPSAAPALPDLAKVPVRRKGDTITIGRGETAHEIDVTVSDEDHAAIAAHLPNQAKQPVKHHTAQGKPDAGYEQLSLAATLSRNVRADLEDVARLHDGYVQRMENGGILSPAEAADMDDLEDIQGRLEKELQQDKTAQKIVQEAEAAAAPQKGAADYAVEIPVDGEWTKFQTVQEAEHAAYQEWIKEGRKNAVNYSTTGDREPSGGPKARFQDNIAALRLLQYLDADGQQASPEQQQVLARYVSWGGLSDAFDGKKAEWAGEYKTLKELLPAQEYEAARASTLTSFYTPPEIIRTMYETLERFGLKGGNILEPSMGVGAFFANRPASFDTNGTMLYGVELDPVTGRIAQQLFPKANIQITGYEKASLPDSFFDAVVGNVPFGQYKVNDPAFNRYNFLIHDYFAAKNIDKLRVGGIQAIITTSGTMDKKSEDVRRYLAARCDLIGAVRLPNTAFKAAAGTEVTADILFLQKRDGVLSNPEADWLHVGQTADGIPMNQYFIDHPEMICGKMEMVSGPYGPRPTCQPDTDTSLEEQLRTAMGRLQAVLPELAPLAIGDEENAASSKAIPADPAVRNYSYCVRDGKIYFRRDSLMWEQTPNAMTRQRIEGMVGLLSATRELIQAQVNDLPEEEIARLQRQLSRQYDDYVSKYGRLYSRANNAAFHEDSGYSLLRSLERVDEEGNFAGKADMFTKRTIRPTRVIDHVDTAAEALVVSLAEHGGIDLAYMQQLSGKTQEELVKDLSGLMFRVPGMGTEEDPVYQTAEEYLSGNVRQKLEQARQAAALDPVYRANADALAAVQPKELTASEINVHLGTTWIPADDVRQFVLELMQPNAWVAQHIQVHYEPVTARWSVTGGRMDSVNVRATATYGTNFSSFRAVLENISAQIPVKIAAREEIEKNIESAKEAAKQPFAYEEEFQTKLARLNELNILLDQEKQELVQNEKENRMQKENVNLHAEENEDWEASTVEPAAKLPAGWKWTMYSDGSGRLEGPDKQSLYSYDRMTYASAGEIEYRKSNNSSWDVFPEGSLDRFREWAEQQLLQELKKEPLQYQEFLEHQSHQDDEIEKNPLDMEDAARQAGLTVQRDQDKPGAAYFDADQNVIHVSDAGSEEDVRLSELKGYADAVIQRTATVEQPVRDLESASLAVMLAARYDVGVSDRLSQQLASAHAEAVKCPTFDLPVTLQRLDKALDYCDHFLAHEQERALEQEAENEPEPEQVTELSPQSQAFMMDL